MKTDKQTTKKPQPGRERLIEKDGKHYWLKSDGSMRETSWILRDGMAVLTGSKINTENL